MASKFDDDQLRNLALKLTDPYDQPDLTFEVSPDVELIDILNIYTFERYPAEKAFCVECCGRHHKRGFTAILTNGKRALYGSTCGARRFEQSWTAAEKRIEERADRQFEIKKLDRLNRMFAPLERGVAAWLLPLQKLAGKRAAFDKHLGELASRVRESVSKQGALTVFYEVQSGAARAAGMRQGAVHQEVIVARVAGYELFQDLDPGKVVEQTFDALAAMKAPTGNLTTQRLAARRRALERCLSDLEVCAKMHAAAEEFFTVENFRGMLRWTNENSGTKARYEVTEARIAREIGRQGGIALQPADAIDTTLLDLISDYRRAD